MDELSTSLTDRRSLHTVAVDVETDVVWEVDTALGGEAAGVVLVEIVDATSDPLEAVASGLAIALGLRLVMEALDAAAALPRRAGAALNVAQAGSHQAVNVAAVDGHGSARDRREHQHQGDGHEHYLSAGHDHFLVCS